MSGKHFLPRADGPLVAWIARFYRQLEANPQRFGLSAEAVAALGPKVEALVQAYAACKSPTTRSPAAIAVKDGARVAAVSATRQLVKVLQASPAMTHDLRAELGLPIRKRKRSRIARPRHAPKVSIAAVRGGVFTVVLHNAQTGARCKPHGVESAFVYTFVGDHPPTQSEPWRMGGAMGGCYQRMDLGANLRPGDSVWLVAAWVNGRGEQGPRSWPVQGRVNWDAILPAA